jgi:predicted ATPase
MDRPIVLFLDDIQWANQTEIFLLSSLAAIPLETPMSGFMLLCTLRTNEVTSEHPISGGLQEMKKLGIHINEIQVSNMVNDEVQDLIKEALHLQFKEATALSKLVYRQTDGNLLFVILLVEALNEDGILPRSGSSALDWDRINKFMKAFRSVNGLLVKTIQQLPEHAQELLKTASCLGPSFSLAVLAPMEVVDTDLLWSVLVDIEQVGLISLEEASKTGRFIHDRVQKAAYTLVPQTGRAALHLEIGRRLWKSIPRSQHNELLPLIAQQISRGVDLVYDPFEKDDLAEMYYKAGQKAAISSAFATAAIYLNMGIQLLSRHHWRDQYQLSLRLYNLAAEIAYYNGDLQRMDELVRAIINRARSFEDKLRAHFTRIYSLGSRNETEQALDESLDVLKTLGESFPSRPNSIHILVGTMRLHFLFLGKSDADIMNLSLMTDPKRVAAMRLMCIMTPYAFYTRTPLSVLLTFRMIEYTLRYGLNDMGESQHYL